MSRDFIQGSAITACLIILFFILQHVKRIEKDVASTREITLDSLYKIDRINEEKRTISICGEIVLPQEP